MLARDVAYAQLPRASKASRHVAAATWIESKAPECLEDLAAVLAYHYTAALDLAVAVGQTEQVSELEATAFRFLTLAGERALGLDTAAALDAFERTLALTPEGHPARPEALASFGKAAHQSGHFSGAAQALEEAITAFRGRGEVLPAARATVTLSYVLSRMNDPRGAELTFGALALLESLPPGPEFVEALANVAFLTAVGGKPDEGLALADRAAVIAAELGLPRPARSLEVRAIARCTLGDAGGLQDYREALGLAIQAGQGREAGSLYNNLGIDLRSFVGLRAALETFREGLEFAEARGLREAALLIASSALFTMLGAGELEKALASVPALAERAEAADDEWDLIEIRRVQVVALTLRGRAEEASEFLDRLASSSRETGRPDIIAVGLGGTAVACAALGETGAAVALLEELEATPSLGYDTEFPFYLSAIVRTALSIGQLELAERLVGHLTSSYPSAEHALVAANAALAEASGETETPEGAYADAASRWEGFGVVPERGFALLGQGRCLLALSRLSDSSEILRQAREIFAGCGMQPALDETDDLLAQATALSS